MPFESGEVLVIASVVHVMVMVKGLVVVAARLSVTRMVKENMPVAVGVPEIRPAELSVVPVGSVPADRDHV